MWIPITVRHRKNKRKAKERAKTKRRKTKERHGVKYVVLVPL